MRKKYLYFLIMIVTLFCFFNFNVSASSILPVKDAWIVSDKAIYVLREDGNLYYGDSIDTETPKLVLENIKEFKNRVALNISGDVYLINNLYETTLVASGAKEIYSFPGFNYAYIDENLVLRGRRYESSHKEDVVIMDNVRSCYDNTNYVITEEDKLYEVNIDKNTIDEIMTNVKNIKPANNDLLILRNNGDLYLYKKTETPNRIGTNVEDMTKVVVRDTWVKHYEIQYINKNGEYFAGTAISDMKKYMDNVREIYLYEDSAYALTYDNILYRFRNCNFDLSSYYTTKTYDVKKMLGKNDYLVLKTDYKVYAIKNVYKKDTYVTDNVKDVIIYEGSVGLDDDRYLFIKNDGSLYGAYGDDNFVPKTPFITSFCQKPTKVLINNKNIELTAKIQMINNRSMYPFRECLENMGATVLWDNVNQIAIGEYNGITIEFPIGRNEYWINGVKHEMDTSSYIDNSIGRTYIPIRFAAEGLGFTVDWTEGELENTISIHK